MSENERQNAYSMLQEAIDCANGGNGERARTLALISIAASLLGNQNNHSHAPHIDSVIADLADTFFNAPEETTFANLQLALNSRKNISGGNA